MKQSALEVVGSEPVSTPAAFSRQLCDLQISLQRANSPDSSGLDAAAEAEAEPVLVRSRRAESESMQARSQRVA